MANSTDFFRRLANLLVYRKGDQRAPHKPLYLLFCLAALQQGKDRLQEFDEIATVLKSALHMFGPRTESVHPEYPFWRLQHDGLAEVKADSAIEIRASNSDPTVRSLRQNNAKGGLLAADFDILNGNLQLQSLAIHKILDAHFPESIHDEIVRFFGLTLDNPHAKDKRSDIEFREDVLSAYGKRCALTGFGVSVGNRVIGVEAAHIYWPQSGGNDDASNGIAMTSLHRKLFHLGLFAIKQDFSIVVSPAVADYGDSPLSLSTVSGQKIRLPQNQAFWPDAAALAWHERWVFRG